MYVFLLDGEVIFSSTIERQDSAQELPVNYYDLSPEQRAFPVWNGKEILVDEILLVASKDRQSALEAAEKELAIAESNYEYARARSRAYISAYSKDPKANPIDASGHVLDDILSFCEAVIEGMNLSGPAVDRIREILSTRDKIKAEFPKPEAAL